MSIIQGNAVSAGGFYPKEIEQSLRLNDDDSAYLSWTPASAGNRKTWTFSTWVKRGNIGAFQFMFSSGTATTSQGYQLLYFSDTDKLAALSSSNNAVNELHLETTRLFRDISSWYHIVLSIDTTQSTSSDRAKLFVNGVQITDFSTETYPTQNDDLEINRTISHEIGKDGRDAQGFYLDGYLAETHFIDGTAYTASDFGEFKNGVWIPKAFAGSYGTNGFYLPFNNDYTVEGFSATTYQGNASTNYIGGVGFSPDLVWVKSRGSVTNHELFDSVRGAGPTLFSNLTNAEGTSNTFSSFENDGFLLDGTAGNVNGSGGSYVAWCWDAGTGSPVSNTDGTITSTVKASTDYGFSVVSYTGTGSNATIGHGLSSAPEMIIVKRRDAVSDWPVYSQALCDVSGQDYTLALNTTGAEDLSSNRFQGTAPTTSLFSIGTSAFTNATTSPYIAYCFHSVAGYSDFGSYTGNGSASGPTITTGFRPAFVMVKRTDSTGSWQLLDATRSPSDLKQDILYPNLSDAEASFTGTEGITTSSTGFEIDTANASFNASGGTYIYMAFADTREAAFWLDQSGNNNDWENNGLTESDISLDSPTNNFCTLNSTQPLSGLSSLAEGNLQSVGLNATFAGHVPATFSATTGKWYFEVNIKTLPSGGGSWPIIGIVENLLTTAPNDDYPGDAGLRGVGYVRSGDINVNGSTVTTVTGTTAGDIVGVAFDVDAGTCALYLNGTLKYTATGLTGSSYTPDVSNYYNSVCIANFGQDSSFAGNKVAQGNVDANGIGDFYYAPPAGYLALCTANLPEPAIGPNSATTSDEHFNAVLYSGTGASQSISVGFPSDLVWIKARTQAWNHLLLDKVRGVHNYLSSNDTDAEIDNSGTLTAFNSDGFTVSFDAEANGSGESFVAWNWKANGSGVSNTDGSITSTVSANMDAGFSIVGYTGNSTAGATIGHGLSQTPEMIIVKNRDRVADWHIYHTSLGATKNLKFTTAAEATQPGVFNDTEPTATVFTVGTNSALNASSEDIIAYCFHSVSGFSAFGSYTGNGSADGPFVYTGFRPAYLVVKKTSAVGSWLVQDSARSPSNVVDEYLIIDTSGAESSGVDFHDFLSNGFKARFTNSTWNTSGATYIYMAFAENPFKYSNAR